MDSLFEQLLHWLRLAVEAAAAFWLAVGFVNAIVQLVADHLRHRIATSFRDIRLTFSRYLLLALEFQLGADILATTIAPTYNDLATLAIVAVIRTGLNYFLSKEVREAHETLARLKIPLRGDAAFPTDARPAEV
jgi:uncharacterized membrane protein